MAQKKISELTQGSINDTTQVVGVDMGLAEGSRVTERLPLGAKLAEIASTLATQGASINQVWSLLDFAVGIAGGIYGRFNDGTTIFNQKWVTHSGKYIYIMMMPLTDNAQLQAYDQQGERLTTFDFGGGYAGELSEFMSSQCPSTFGEMKASGDVYVWISQQDYLSGALYTWLNSLDTALGQKADTSALAGYATTEYVNGLVGNINDILATI